LRLGVEYFRKALAPQARETLGAALANLAVARLIGNKSVTPDRLTVYTFSGPRVGNPIFADQF